SREPLSAPATAPAISRGFLLAAFAAAMAPSHWKSARSVRSERRVAPRPASNPSFSNAAPAAADSLPARSSVSLIRIGLLELNQESRVFSVGRESDSARDEDLGVDHRDDGLPDPALTAVSVTALVPYHPHCEPFDRERTVHHLELVGTVAYEPFRD